MITSDVSTWACPTHARPIDAGCAECARIVNALNVTFPRLRAHWKRTLATELLLGFAASQYGRAVAGDFGATPEAEEHARLTLQSAAMMFAAARTQ